MSEEYHGDTTKELQPVQAFLRKYTPPLSSRELADEEIWRAEQKTEYCERSAGSTE